MLTEDQMCHYHYYSHWWEHERNSRLINCSLLLNRTCSFTSSRAKSLVASRVTDLQGVVDRQSNSYWQWRHTQLLYFVRRGENHLEKNLWEARIWTQAVHAESKPLIMAATLLLSGEVMNKQCKRQRKTPWKAVGEMKILHFMCIHNAICLRLSVTSRRA